MIRDRRDTKLKKGWFESFIDDTNFVEKILFIAWGGLIGMFYIMFDMFNIWIRILLSGGLFIIISILIYWFGRFMSGEERYWN